MENHIDPRALTKEKTCNREKLRRKEEKYISIPSMKKQKKQRNH
jgi:hypothetical protein